MKMKSKVKISISIVIASLFALTSCDYYGTYNYVIENRLNEPILVTLTSNNFDSIRNKVFKIYPSDTLLLLTSGTENLGRNEQPNGVYTKELFAIAEIRIADTLNNIFDKDFRMADYWRYNVTGKREGTYKLILDSALHN